MKYSIFSSVWAIWYERIFRNIGDCPISDPVLCRTIKDTNQFFVSSKELKVILHMLCNSETNEKQILQSALGCRNLFSSDWFINANLFYLRARYTLFKCYLIQDDAEAMQYIVHYKLLAITDECRKQNVSLLASDSREILHLKIYLLND